MKAQLPNEYTAGYGPRLSAFIAERSGIHGDSREVVMSFYKSVFNFDISIGAIQKVAVTSQGRFIVHRHLLINNLNDERVFDFS